jgi:hypothetical protein
MARRADVRSPRAGGTLHRPAGEPLDWAIRELQEAIDVLVAERQALRSAGAGRAALEDNRLELGRQQRLLALALIGRHGPPSGAGDAQDELQRSLGARPVLAHQRLAA